MKKKVFLLVLFLALLFKSLTWLIALPVWQTPDEQAHFAQLQWLAEKKSANIDPINNLSVEVATSEAVLGTFRDPFGNNKFTYHPEYKNPIIGTLSDRSLSVFNLPVDSRTTYIGHEAAMYPWLYYQLDLPFYNLFYSNSIIDRVYAARIPSLIFGALLVLVAYKVGQEIWKERHKSLVLAILVGFQPMTSFVAAGIHPDNLLNFLYSLVLLFCVLILKNGLKWKYLAAIAVSLLAGYETKALMLLAVPVVAALLAVKIIPNKLISFLTAAAIMVAPVLVFVFQIHLYFVPVVTAHSPLYSMDFWQYLHFRLPKLFFEIWPWYWGVFKWLSLTLPPVVLKIITRVAIFAGVGLSLKFLMAIKNRNFNFEFKTMSLFLLSSLFYLIYLVLWDWRLMQALGFSQGLQGRYFFPNIMAHMGLVMFGLSWGRFTKPILITTAISMIILNFLTLRYVYLSYY